MPQTDLIARLEKMATARELVAQQRAQEAHISEVDGFGTMAKLERQLSKEHATVAADLRAAAAAVRLVAECREALGKAKRTSKGWYEHTTEALAAISEWEGKL